MVGVNFAKQPGVAETGMKLSEVLQGTFSLYDTLLLLKETGGYDTYRYFDQDTIDGVIEEGDLPEGSLAGWYNTSLVYGSDLVLTNGASFWVYPQAEVTVIAAGEVGAVSVTRALKQGYNMVSVPFPIIANLNDFTYTGALYDSILVLKATGGYDTYRYFDQETIDGVIEEGDLPEGSLAGWYNTSLVYGTAVDIGTGFWVYVQGAGGASLTMNSPIAN